MPDRYKVIPRNLVFLFHGDEVLLIKHHSKDKVGFGKWNGVGGHVEKEEDPYHSAIREIREETGLEINRIKLEFISIIPETDAYGICLFIFSGRSRTKKTVESIEGQLKWIKIDQLSHYHLMEDLETILELILNRKKRNLNHILSYVRGKNGFEVQMIR